MKRIGWNMLVAGIIAGISAGAQVISNPGILTVDSSGGSKNALLKSDPPVGGGVLVANNTNPAVLNNGYPGQSILKPGAGSGGALQYKKPVPLAAVREADVMWSKRIWRTLDLREKMNHPYYYPLDKRVDLKSLFDVLKDGLRAGQLTAFGNPAMDDEFTQPLSRTEIEALLVQVNEVVSVNPVTMLEDTVNVQSEIAAGDVVQYWVKEDWFIDKQRSVMECRILGICPLVQKVSESGEVVGVKPLFWIYFPEARPLLAQSPVFLGQNNVRQLTFDDLFQKRMFASYIHKESSVQDRWINSYSTGMDAMLESERVKEGMMNYEFDLWHY